MSQQGQKHSVTQPCLFITIVILDNWMPLVLFLKRKARKQLLSEFSGNPLKFLRKKIHQKSLNYICMSVLMHPLFWIYWTSFKVKHLKCVCERERVNWSLVPVFVDVYSGLTSTYKVKFRAKTQRCEKCRRREETNTGIINLTFIKLSSVNRKRDQTQETVTQSLHEAFSVIKEKSYILMSDWSTSTSTQHALCCEVTDWFTVCHLMDKLKKYNITHLFIFSTGIQDATHFLKKWKRSASKTPKNPMVIQHGLK